MKHITQMSDEVFANFIKEMYGFMPVKYVSREEFAKRYPKADMDNISAEIEEKPEKETHDME